MREPKIQELSERQIQCLLLVADGVTTSKQIERRTGLKAASIDNYLSRAAILFGVEGRAAAAAAYLAHRDRAENSVPASVSRIERLIRPAKAASYGVVAALRWLLKVPPLGGRQHDLNRVEIVVSILKVAAVSFTVFLVLVLMGAGLLWVLH